MRHEYMKCNAVTAAIVAATKKEKSLPFSYLHLKTLYHLQWWRWLASIHNIKWWLQQQGHSCLLEEEADSRMGDQCWKLLVLQKRHRKSENQAKMDAVITHTCIHKQSIKSTKNTFQSVFIHARNKLQKFHTIYFIAFVLTMTEKWPLH